MTSFIPRTTFPYLDSLPRSYFLGHHRAGLNKMKTMLSDVDLIIECRDYRLPLTSRNPLFEETLAGKKRLIVYTKQDLGSGGKQEDQVREELIQQWQRPSSVLFSNHKEKQSVRKVLAFARDHAISRDSLIGSRMMIVGMPNVGKSSLLNALRRVGVWKKKAAITGAQPGVTRKIGTSVKILEGQNGEGGVYLVDTPGVFVPYVPNAESMLKLALCGSVKDNIIAPTTLADYLLFHLNLQDPSLYTEYASPTNEIMEILQAMARKTGKIRKGALPDEDASALWMIQRWRKAHLGRFVLDQVTPASLAADPHVTETSGMSLNQARRAGKAIRKQKSMQKYLDVG